MTFVISKMVSKQYDLRGNVLLLLFVYILVVYLSFLMFIQIPFGTSISIFYFTMLDALFCFVPMQPVPINSTFICYLLFIHFFYFH